MSVPPPRGATPTPPDAARFRREQLQFVILGVILCDVAVLGGNALHLFVPELGPTEAVAWNGDLDGSHVEMLGHQQLLLVVVLLGLLWRRDRSPVYAAWALLFGVVLTDDFLTVHEIGGAWLARTLDLGIGFGLRPIDLGELIVWAMLGVPLVVVTVLAHLRSPVQDRFISVVLVGLLVLLAAFTVVLDMSNIALTSRVTDRTMEVLRLLETTGELVSMSLVLVVVHRFTLRPASAGPRRPGMVDQPPTR